MFLYFIIHFIKIWRNNICNHTFHIHQEFLELFVCICGLCSSKWFVLPWGGIDKNRFVQELTMNLYCFAEMLCLWKSQALETEGKVWSKEDLPLVEDNQVRVYSSKLGVQESYGPWWDAPLTAGGAGWCHGEASLGILQRCLPTLNSLILWCYTQAEFQVEYLYCSSWGHYRAKIN